MLKTIAGTLLASVVLVSCSVRLPVTPYKAGQTPAAAAIPAAPAKDPHVLVWLTADEYHTGMVFPFDWLEESGFIAPAGFGNPRYVAMSWGNRNAYSREGIDNTWKMIQVLATPTPAVMEVIPANWNVTEVWPHQRIWRKLVHRDKGPALADFLNQCSTMDAAGRPRVIRESSWGHGVQLESRYSYFIPRVCNVWTVQAIERLGGDFNAWFALTANGLIRQAEKPPNNFEKIWPGGGKPMRP